MPFWTLTIVLPPRNNFETNLFMSLPFYALTRLCAESHAARLTLIFKLSTPQDVFGNTPLGALCEAFPRGLSQCIEELEEVGCVEDYAENDWLLILTQHACYQRGKTHFLTFLLEQKGLKVIQVYLLLSHSLIKVA